MKTPLITVNFQDRLLDINTNRLHFVKSFESTKFYILFILFYTFKETTKKIKYIFNKRGVILLITFLRYNPYYFAKRKLLQNIIMNDNTICCPISTFGICCMDTALFLLLRNHTFFVSDDLCLDNLFY
jgi:hypothetical protein